MTKPIPLPVLIFFFTFLIFFLFTPSVGAWTLTPMKLERTLKPGESFTDVLVVDNAGSSEPKRFELKIVDWSLDKKGDLVYTEPNASNNSIGKFLLCTPMQFRALPGERKLIRFTLSLPPGVSSGEHTLGIQVLETIIPQRSGEGGRINVGVAVKCGFLTAMSILVPKVQAKVIEPVSLGLSHSPNLSVVDLQIKNSSNVRARPMWSFQIFDKDNKLIAEQRPVDFLVLKESERLISSPLKKNLPVGRYRLVGKLDQGLPFPIQEIEKDIDITGPN